MQYPSSTKQVEKMVETLRKGNHAKYEGALFRVEVFRAHDRQGEAFVMLTSNKDDISDTSEITLRSPSSLIDFMRDWAGLSKWVVYNPYPEDPEFSDEDMYELMNNTYTAQIREDDNVPD